MLPIYPNNYINRRKGNCSNSKFSICLIAIKKLPSLEIYQIYSSTVGY